MNINKARYVANIINQLGINKEYDSLIKEMAEKMLRDDELFTINYKEAEERILAPCYGTQFDDTEQAVAMDTSRYLDI